MARKVRMETVIDSDIKAKVEEHAKNENRSLSNHVETILKSDVEKRELPKPFISKQEYKS